MKVPFLNTYYHCLVDQVHQLHIIKDTSLMGSDSTQENEKKGEKTQNSRVIVTAEVSSFASARDMNPISSHISYYDVLIVGHGALKACNLYCFMKTIFYI